MRRVIGPIIVAAGVLVAAAAVRPDRPPPPDLRFVTRGSTQLLDPAQMSYMQDIQLCQMLWEGLTRFDPRGGPPLPGVAYLPPEIDEDGRRYVFTLRSEARWSNGDPVTAGDFIRGWRRAIEPGTADVYAELISTHIAGARDYAEWRGQVVSVLSVMRKLQRGSPLRGEVVAQAFRGEAGRPLRELLGRPLAEPLPPDQNEFWEGIAAELQGRSVNWKRLADDLLDAHIREMDERFARVGLRALDDHRLEVRLDHPLPYLLDLTSFATWMPIHASIERLREGYEGRPLGEAGVWSYDPQWTKPVPGRNGYPGLIGNGPYRLVEWRFRRGLRFEANPFYWDRTGVRSARVEALEIEYQNSAFLRYEQGEIDLMIDLSMDYTPELVRLAREGRRNDIHPVPCFGTFYLTFNCREKLNDGRPNPLSDVRLRLALTHGTNRQEIVDHVIRLGNPVSRTFVPAGQLPGYPSPRGLDYDLELARRYLAEAGFPGGRGLPPIEYLYSREALQESIAQALKRMWERDLGIRVELLGKETKAFAEDKSKHRFMISRSGWFGDYMAPTTFLDLYHSANGHNSAGFRDPLYDELLAQAAREPDPTRRYELLSRAEARLVEEMVPLLPLGTYVLVCAWRPEVTGIWPNPRALFPVQYIAVRR